MEIHVLKCPHCNADLKIEDGINTFYCQYCGTKIILHGQSDEEIKAKVRLKKFQHEENLQRAKSDHEINKMIVEHAVRTAEEEKKEKDERTGLIVGILGLFGFLALLGFVSVFLANMEENYYTKLNEKVALIQTYIREEKYDEAMILVQEIRAKDNADDEVKEQWESTRKELISQIERAREENIRRNSISLPESSSDMRKKNYQVLLDELKNLGFTNIQVTELDEKAGWFKKAGQVKSVSINGDTWFKSGALYYPDVPIFIYYYSLEK